jgi:hypothetical protein
MAMDVNLSRTSSLSSTGPAQEQDSKQIMLDQKMTDAFNILFKRTPKPESKSEEIKSQLGSPPRA